MEVKVIITGIGAGVPSWGIGLNLLSYCYLEVRANRGAPTSKVYAVDDYFSLGGESSTLIFGYASTDWMTVAPEMEQHLTLNGLRGKQIDLEVNGTSLGNSKGDVTIKLIDDQSDGITLLEKYSVKLYAYQLGTTKVRGRVKYIPLASASSVPAKR